MNDLDNDNFLDLGNSTKIAEHITFCPKPGTAIYGGMKKDRTMMTLSSIAEIPFRSYLDPPLNSNFNKIYEPNKILFAHSAEKEPCALQD